MSLTCDAIAEGSERKQVALFAQILANCESTNFSVAQQAHEDVDELRMTMSDMDYDGLLSQATEYMFRHALVAEVWLPG